MKQYHMRKFYVDLGEIGIEAFEMMRKLFILENSA
jgi:hypothetical protein